MFSILRCTNRFQNTTCTKIVYRQYMKISEKMEMLLKKTDNIPQDYNLVYRETSRQMKYYSVNLLTCTTAVLTGIQFYKESSEGLPAHVLHPIQFGLAGFLVIAFFAITQVMRKRYPLRIYFCEKKKVFRAIFIGRLPFTTESYEYPQESARYCHKGSILPWNDSLLEANGRKIYLYDGKFKTLSDFHRMLKPSELMN